MVRRSESLVGDDEDTRHRRVEDGGFAIGRDKVHKAGVCHLGHGYSPNLVEPTDGGGAGSDVTLQGKRNPRKEKVTESRNQEMQSGTR